MTISPRLTGNTPELTDADRANFFGPLPPQEQEQLADLFWQCETPEQRGIIYGELRQWWTDACFGVN